MKRKKGLAGTGLPVVSGRKKSIKKELFHKISSVAVCISVVFGLINIVMLYQNSQKYMRDETQTTVTAYSSSMQNIVGKLKLSAEVIARNDYITDPGRSIDDKKISLSVQAKRYGFHDISVSDSHGKTYNDTDISDREYFKQAFNGKTYVSSTMIRKTDNSVVMFAAARVNNSTNYQGIIYCAIDVASFNQAIENVKIGNKGFGFILDKTGTVIADQNIDNVNNFVNYINEAQTDSSQADMASVSKAMTAGEVGGQKVTLNGRQLYIAYAPISDTDGWSVAVAADVNEMMGSFYTAIYITAALIFLFVLLSLLLSRSMSKPIVSPILSLVERIQTLAKGDLHTEVPAVHTNNEIQTLSESFTETVTSLNSYIGEISSLLNSMSGGDFSLQIRQNYLGDFVEVKNSLNQIILSMNGMFRDIYDLSEQVAVGSRQMESGAKVLAQGATEQAGTIQELSDSVRSVANEAEQNAENAANASEIYSKTLHEISGGNHQMEKMMEAMTKIDQSSGEIGKIVKTIENIAFQTKILALNAAVEAARAGQEGKGFSVVADEVRNLAGKSSQAVKSTSTLIQNSVEAVQQGRKIAENTAKSLQSIISEVEKMAELVRTISKASGNQAQEMKRINAGMDKISAVVQTTSATAEQSAATSEEMRRLAQALKDMLDRFTLLEQENSGGEP